MLYLIVFFSFLFSQEPVWTAKLKRDTSMPLEKDMLKQALVLSFKDKKGTVKNYKIRKSPKGLAKKMTLIVENRELHFTYWPNGAQAQLLRVFEPSVSEDPICEEITFSANSSVRIVNGILEVEVYPDPRRHKKKIVSQWKPCGKKSPAI